MPERHVEDAMGSTPGRINDRMSADEAQVAVRASPGEAEALAKDIEGKLQAYCPHGCDALLTRAEMDTHVCPEPEQQFEAHRQCATSWCGKPAGHDGKCEPYGDRQQQLGPQPDRDHPRRFRFPARDGANGPFSALVHKDNANGTLARMEESWERHLRERLVLERQRIANGLRQTASEVREGDAGMTAAQWLDSEANRIDRQHGLQDSHT